MKDVSIVANIGRVTRYEVEYSTEILKASDKFSDSQFGINYYFREPRKSIVLVYSNPPNSH